MSKIQSLVVSGVFVLAAAMLVSLACDDPIHFGPETEPQYLTFDDYPRWSHSGDRIAFMAPGTRDSVAGYKIYVVDTTGENLHSVVRGGVAAVWLPGDSQLVVMGGDFKLYLLNLRSGSLSSLCDCVDARFPEVDPTGTYLYYEDAGVADGWATSIYRMDLATSDTTHIIGGSHPIISPDGNRILFERNELRCYDVTADSEWVVFNPGFQAHPTWSPDGAEIVVGNVLKDNLYNQLYKVKPDGGDRRYLTTGISPRYSPSGDRIAIARYGPDNRSHIWLIDPDGGNPKQITF